MDAARALLGVSPFSLSSGEAQPILDNCVPLKQTNAPVKSFSDGNEAMPCGGRQRSDSAGLEALAFLATKEQASLEVSAPSAVLYTSSSTSSIWDQSSSQVLNKRPLIASAVSSSSSSSSDEDSMPPPPPRRGTTRRRSVSNPEGMEKWVPKEKGRLRFVLPASILEEELAEASAAMRAKEERMSSEADDDIEKASDETEVPEEDLSHEELLRRARSRLLEDLSEVNLSGEKGILTLPHSLAKYKEVYNKKGRIGIYTPAERAAIIARFHGKRSRRVWNKKIRYNCRKNLADRRMRVKGRFVKRSTEEQAKLNGSASSSKSVVPSTIPEDAKFLDTSTDITTNSVNDQDMPDVKDPDAGFCPTDDQPFRRTRRHTIT